MSKYNMGTRRGTLQNVMHLLKDERELANAVGKDVELDCTLLAMSMVINDDLTSETLNKYLNVHELRDDIQKVYVDYGLRKILEGRN